MTEQELAQKYLIFKCIAGSKSYGTNTKNSDTDIRGIFIAPAEYTYGCLKNIEQVTMSENDTTIYELAKFIKLAIDANPNIIELLFTDDENILFIDPIFQRIRDQKHLFLSKKTKFTFGGYATAQLKRIRGHNKWISQPQPKDSPQLLDFAKIIFRDGTVRPGSVLKNCVDMFLVKFNATTFKMYFSTVFSKNPISDDCNNLQYISEDKFDALKLSKSSEFYGTLIIQIDTFKVQHRIWKDYWHWKKNRNLVRATLEEKFNYDTKHAQHLIRLLRMAKEILSEGNVIVRRPDALELVEIRNGKFDYETILQMATTMEEELNELYEKSSLPKFPDRDAINDLYIDIVREFLCQRKS